MTQITLRSAGLASSRSTSRAAAALNAIQLWRSRRALARLDARMLEDLGVSAEAAAAEASRSPWDVPAYWGKVADAKPPHDTGSPLKNGTIGPIFLSILRARCVRVNLLVNWRS